MPATFGPYSPAVRAGDFIFVSGQLGAQDPGTGAAIDGIEGQTRQAMENMQQVLLDSGATMNDVVKVTVFLRNSVDFPKMNEAYVQFFTGRRPARSTVVTNLVKPEWLVEIDCVAYRPVK